MALIGNETARRLLIRDPRKNVAMAVLQNPKISDREISMFSAQRSLQDDVIGAIARNREWTRFYPTRLALARNPKTPAQLAISFLATFSDRDLKALSRDREIPGYVQKQAKIQVDQRRTRRR